MTFKELRIWQHHPALTAADSACRKRRYGCWVHICSVSDLLQKGNLRCWTTWWHGVMQILVLSESSSSFLLNVMLERWCRGFQPYQTPFFAFSWWRDCSSLRAWHGFLCRRRRDDKPCKCIGWATRGNQAWPSHQIWESWENSPQAGCQKELHWLDAQKPTREQDWNSQIGVTDSILWRVSSFYQNGFCDGEGGWWSTSLPASISLQRQWDVTGRNQHLPSFNLAHSTKMISQQINARMWIHIGNDKLLLVGIWGITYAGIAWLRNEMKTVMLLITWHYFESKLTGKARDKEGWWDRALGKTKESNEKSERRKAFKPHCACVTRDSSYDHRCLICREMALRSHFRPLENKIIHTSFFSRAITKKKSRWISWEWRNNSREQFSCFPRKVHEFSSLHVKCNKKLQIWVLLLRIVTVANNKPFVSQKKLVLVTSSERRSLFPFIMVHKRLRYQRGKWSITKPPGASAESFICGRHVSVQHGYRFLPLPWHDSSSFRDDSVRSRTRSKSSWMWNERRRRRNRHQGHHPIIRPLIFLYKHPSSSTC